MLRSDPRAGLGKPELLSHNLSRLWSKRISQKDRLIYKFDDVYLGFGLKKHCIWLLSFVSNNKNQMIGIELLHFNYTVNAQFNVA